MQNYINKIKVFNIFSKNRQTLVRSILKQFYSNWKQCDCSLNFLHSFSLLLHTIQKVQRRKYMKQCSNIDEVKCNLETHYHLN